MFLHQQHTGQIIALKMADIPIDEIYLLLDLGRPIFIILIHFKIEIIFYRKLTVKIVNVKILITLLFFLRKVRYEQFKCINWKVNQSNTLDLGLGIIVQELRESRQLSWLKVILKLILVHVSLENNYRSVADRSFCFYKTFSKIEAEQNQNIL